MSENKSGSWFKKIANSIVEITPEENTKQPIQNAPVVNSVQAPTPTPVYNTVNTTGVVDPKLLERFENLLEALNIPGPDYMEFTKALENLEGLGLPEDKKFQAAWGSFGAMGVKDPSVLTIAAQKYIDALNADKATFMEKVNEKINLEVGGLKNRASELEARNKSVSEQIAQLQSEINKNNEEAAAISGKIAEQTVKINNSKNTYEMTQAKVVEEIQKDVTKINQYILQK